MVRRLRMKRRDAASGAVPVGNSIRRLATRIPQLAHQINPQRSPIDDYQPIRRVRLPVGTTRSRSVNLARYMIRCPAASVAVARDAVLRARVAMCQLLPAARQRGRPASKESSEIGHDGQWGTKWTCPSPEVRAKLAGSCFCAPTRVRIINPTSFSASQRRRESASKQRQSFYE
jgi:hypothetical protein